MVSGFVGALERFNRAHPWSHNDLYGGVVVRHARAVRRAGGTCALDVGCGTGGLVLRIAENLPEVTGIERDRTAASIAAVATAERPGVRIVIGSFPEDVAGRFDLVSIVAVLHHLWLVDGLRAARSAVSPGGRLVIVGAYRETLADRPLSILSLLLNPVIGFLKHPKRADRYPPQMTSPTLEPSATLHQIKAAMRGELPGVRVTRVLFWRYVATWTAPASPP